MDAANSNLTLQLPRDMYYHLVHSLHRSLPPPVTDTQEDLTRRDNTAIAQVSCLLPANADEVTLAVQYVAANAQALDSLRLAHLHAADPNRALKCTAQAASMMREARGARSLLLRVQAQRQKRESDPASLDRAAWIEHCSIGLMANALGRTSPAPAAEPPPPPAPPPPDEPAPQPDPAPEADQHAIVYPRPAAPFRSQGGLPDKYDVDPPPPDLVHAIVTGTTPTSRALDAPTPV